MKPYKKLFQQVWNHTDQKPKGQMKQIIQQQTRAQMKVVSAKECSDALKDFQPKVPFSFYVATRNAIKGK